MTRYLSTYGAVAVTFVLLDALWLIFVGPKLYKPIVGEILTGDVRLAPAIIFYVLYAAGIVVLAVRPSSSLTEAVILGAFLGLVAYGTYALTDHAIMKVWATKLTVLDMMWGAVASGAGAAAGYLVFRRMGP